MESLDIKTRLPPRKRLLAGILSKESSFPNIPSFHNELLYDRIHQALNLNSAEFSIDEIIEKVNSVALDAEKSADMARNRAIEKWIVAKQAKANATNALEQLNSVTKAGHVKKLRVVDDGEVALRLHRTMNSSPRILKSPDTRNSGTKRKLDCSNDDIHHEFNVVDGKKTNVAKKKLLSQFNHVKSVDEI